MGAKPTTLFRVQGPFEVKGAGYAGYAVAGCRRRPEQVDLEFIVVARTIEDVETLWQRLLDTGDTPDSSYIYQVLVLDRERVVTAEEDPFS